MISFVAMNFFDFTNKKQKIKIMLLKLLLCINLVCLPVLSCMSINFRLLSIVVRKQ